MNNKQRTIKPSHAHKWETIEHGERVSDFRIERRWCVRCGKHETRKERVVWGDWTPLPQIPVRAKSGTVS